MNTQKQDMALEIEDLSVEYRTGGGIVRALNSLELSIKRGTALGLVGETGAGKTTAGLAILRLIPHPGVITGGSIRLHGADLLEKTEKQMRSVRGKEVSMIFQDPMTSLNPVRTVEEQIAEAIRQHEKAGRAEALGRAREMLEMVGIPAVRGRERITELRRKYRMSMLMITHDLGIVADICDEVSIIYAGHVVEHGTLEDVYRNPLHPYTVGLFNSLPNMADRTAKLKPIKGLMPDPSDLPPGCAFCPRCDRTADVCRTRQPPRVYRNAEHYVCCHLYQDKPFQEVSKDG